MTPNEWLIEYGRKYPQAWKKAAEFRAKRVLYGDWEQYCYLPLLAWKEIISTTFNFNIVKNHDFNTVYEQICEVSRLGALGAWRYTQGIYRFDPEIYNALIDTPMNAEIPIDIIFHLPQWCVYIETPCLKYHNDNVEGFFCYLEYDNTTANTEVYIVLNILKLLLPLKINIEKGDSIKNAMFRTVNIESEKLPIQLSALKDSAASSHEIIEIFTKTISLAMYLCSEEPEIDNDIEPGTSPKYPQEKLVKGIAKLFPPDKPTTWNIGVKTGKKLRQLREEYEQIKQTGRKVKPHIRRAHWHGYWEGPKNTEKRKFTLKWLYPILVGGEE